MPNSPEEDLSIIEKKATTFISAFGGEVGKVIKEPVAFGLTALILMFISDEKKGGTEKLEEEVSQIDGVTSCEVTDVRRTVG